MFMPCERRVCVIMTIAEDVVIEVVRITLEMMSDQNCSILLDPSDGIINIIHGMTMKYRQTNTHFYKYSYCGWI